MYDSSEISRLISLLSGATSIGVVSDFLKRKGLHYSAGSWDQMRDTRLMPALEKSEITEAELLDLLRSAEEHGRQHVFLYQCDVADALAFIGRPRIEAIAASQSLSDLFLKPQILEIPSSSTIVDLRWTTAGVDKTFVLKQVEARSRQELVGPISVVAGLTTKKYQTVMERAVNTIRLHRDGLLEMRIAAHDASSQYHSDVASLWEVVESFSPRERFSELSLSKAKTALFEQRSSLAEKIGFSFANARDDLGRTLRISADGPNATMYESPGLDIGLAQFQSKSGAHIEGQCFTFRAQQDKLSRDVRVLMQGAINAFAITANCSESDYEYVLGEIRKLNS